ncbi:hypothetical protein, partial [Streptomyces sp. NPDC005953]|uniref:hypothetical protein n=1 Tax=Streptomyces sp. NPDC005953 TaxID=3156719 RepID=UPI0033FA9E3C
MFSEPGVRGHRKAAGEQHSIALGHGNDCGKQWVLGVPQPRFNKITSARLDVEPVAVALEGVGGEVDELGAAAGVEGGPVDRGAVDMEVREGCGEREVFR